MKMLIFGIWFSSLTKAWQIISISDKGQELFRRDHCVSGVWLLPRQDGDVEDDEFGLDETMTRRCRTYHPVLVSGRDSQDVLSQGLCLEDLRVVDGWVKLWTVQVPLDRDGHRGCRTRRRGSSILSKDLDLWKKRFEKWINFPVFKMNEWISCLSQLLRNLACVCWPSACPNLIQFRRLRLVCQQFAFTK